MKPSQDVVSSYLHDVYRPNTLATIVHRLASEILAFRKKTSVDAIAFTGHSGSAVAYPLSCKLRIPLVCIRKGKSHSSHIYEGVCPVGNYIIVDDFIDTGRTIRRIKKQVREYSKSANLVGIFLYSQGWHLNQYEDVPVFHVRATSTALV